MCYRGVTVTVSRRDEIIFTWTVEEESVVVGRQSVLDHIFDTSGVYNVCVIAASSGEIFCELFLVHFVFAHLFVSQMCAL